MSATSAEHEIFNGNELLIQGAKEAGFHLYTGYPGSPLADFFNILYRDRKQLENSGVKVVIANSEANAAAMASGAKMAGKNVLVAMKSMGLHVAADALSVGNFANPGLELEEKSGVVIAVGDDPWSMSTSTPADSRYLFKHLHIPFLEPSTPQELKDWMKNALEISKKTSVYQGLLLTTAMAEGGGRVEVSESQELTTDKIRLEPDNFNLQKNVMVPPNSLHADISMIKERFPKVEQAYKEMGLDKIIGNHHSKVGVISVGVIFETLKQFLEDQNYLEHISLYKLASSYPLVDEFMVSYLQNLKALIIVEEKRGFLEGEIRELCQRHGIDIPIYGKKFKNDEGFPAHGGLNYEIVQQKFSELASHIDNGYFKKDCQQFEISFDLGAELPKRLPTFCPGCPHRETLSLLKDLRKSLKDENLNLISHGDVGCYSLSFLEPFKEMHDLSAMGQGGAMAAGTDLFSENPAVVLMGDSTFFHSGISAISNSVQCGHPITYILLDNDNTAMTGHQMTPRSGVDVEGHKRPPQDMIKIVSAMGVKNVVEVNPSDRYFYKNLLTDFVKKPGTKVIISNKECALTYHGRRKNHERKFLDKGITQDKKTFYQINTQTCVDCRECIELTGCPGLTQSFDAYGAKMQIDPQICVSDSYCTKIEACPSFEMVEVLDYHPTKYRPYRKEEKINNDIPPPFERINFDQIAAGRDFRAVVIGVGGSGVTTISRILAEAAKNMGGRNDLDFKFMDQKGLAQRNGSVTSHLSIFRKGRSHGTVNPLGSCDLVLSPDLLEGSRAVSFLSKEGMAFIDENYQVPLSLMLDRGIDMSAHSESIMQENLRQELGSNLFLFPYKNLAFEKYAKAVYASAMILGAVYQAGKLPFSENDLRFAFEKSVRANEFENNWRAFELGRLAYLKKIEPQINDNDELMISLYQESIVEALSFWHTKAETERNFIKNIDELHRSFKIIPRIHWAQYLHDLYVFNHWSNVKQYFKDLHKLHEGYPHDKDFVLAVKILTRSYFIKDEVFVSHLLSSSMRLELDRLQYGNLGSSYQLTNINKPEFVIFGKHIKFDINPKPWMFKIMRKLRILRKLLPEWHSKEKQINQQIKSAVLEEIAALPSDQRKNKLEALERIKGYREVLYAKAKQHGLKI